MAVYMVGYDLDRPGQDYNSLIDAIKAYGTWWHHLDSTWLIATNENATEVRDNLAQHIDDNDKLLVANIGAPGAWAGMNESSSQWLVKHLH